MPTLHVAIIGSGPAGYYTAEALAKRGNVHVDIIDRLPTPFGLIRGGVAPDHQSIKQVYRRYEKTALSDNVRFAGHVEIGRDVSIAELRELYDAVVLATGAGEERPLGIPGENKAGVIGSAAFVGWYNSHPDFAELAPNLNIPSVAVIGNGNVAVDVVRVLAKTEQEMAASDLAAYAAETIHPAPIRDIHMFGRRGPMEASFTPKELGELGEMTRCVALVDADQIPETVDTEGLEPKEANVRVKNLEHLKAFIPNQPEDKPVRLHITFYARPVEVLGDAKVEALRMEKTRVEAGQCVGTGEIYDIPCGLVVPCIGYRTAPIKGVPFDEWSGRFLNEDGLIASGLYAVGWARRGPTGTIGTNRPDGIGIAEKILTEMPPSGKRGREGLDELLVERSVKIATFQDWKKIEAAEMAAAKGAAPRSKFADIDEMMRIVRGQA